MQDMRVRAILAGRPGDGPAQLITMRLMYILMHTLHSFGKYLVF